MVRLSLPSRAWWDGSVRDLRAAQAVAEERTRIARELHDVVAHRVSQITLLAGGLAVSPNSTAGEVGETIRQSGRTALEEMRELLGVLRRGTDAAPPHPPPAPGELRTLVEGAAATGQRVRADHAGPARRRS
ncbi:histidine kinase [Gandjariella thermophila]|uniref:histidine kinase n=1 Tax=Gandjariella thermophila TaxID=1931992 RepID=A0A4D4J7M5_9PSEU|nr:histidine kinase dimerization/phosphoacceptor domain-containing protein [Gandjariella thermophila]GDY31020.1 hypothetical protein GTS_26530 [Gandjariella thermophila]